MSRRSHHAKARIVLVDDHPIVREHLAQLINQQDDLVVIGSFDGPLAAKEWVQRQPPDLLITDLSLKNAHGMDLIADLQKSMPKLPVLVLSMHDEPLYAERALRAGARGYITKQEATQSIMIAIRQVLDGAVYLSQEMSEQLVGTLLGIRRETAGTITERLTVRELEVFELMGRGLARREVAVALCIDVKTVDTYQCRLREKFNCGTSDDLRQQAVLWRAQRPKK